MASVTGRIKEIKQPRGGYIKPSDFEETTYDDGLVLYENENVHGSIVGMVIDYLTRFVMGTDLVDAFAVSLEGAAYAEKLGKKKSIAIAKKLLKNIKGIDDQSIIAASKLVTFDVWFRNPFDAVLAKDYKETNPDEMTIRNIQVLIKRSVDFFDRYGPIVADGYNFEPAKPSLKSYERMVIEHKGSYGGYTYVVDSGDGDFLTKDTLWDFKVSKSKPTSRHTLQLLMYWIMGQHSKQKIFKDITKIGIFNPRLNVVYLYNISSVPTETIRIVEKEVIGY